MFWPISRGTLVITITFIIRKKTTRDYPVAPLRACGPQIDLISARKPFSVFPALLTRGRDAPLEGLS